jgi:endonuclease G, mitochondrial
MIHFNSFFSKIVTACFICLFFSECSKKKSEVNSSDPTNFYTQPNTMTSSKFDYLPTSTTNEIVKHDYYTLSYSEPHEQAEWVAYELKQDQLSRSHFERPYFIDDPEVATGSASWKNYKRSGYDKGHLCAAADRSFSKKAFDETFYTSNISPQKHDFNEGVWNRLEQKTRYWATKYDGIYVVTGGVLCDGLQSIGNENVSVPQFFYKVLLDNTGGKYKAIAFLVPHEDSEIPLNKFVVSIDKLEQMTSIDFFPKLPDAIENKLEKTADYKDWSF